MKMDIHDWDTLMHRLLLATIVVVIYAGPAATVTLDNILREEFDWGESAGFEEWLPFIFFVGRRRWQCLMSY